MTASGIAVGGEMQFRPFHSEATAGFDLAKSQQFSLRNVSVATFASAMPKRTIVGATSESDHRQSAKNVSRDIDENGQVNLLEWFAGQVTEPTCRLAPLRILADFRR
jgi:hypothetical protein